MTHALFHYALQSALCLSTLYLLWLAAMRRETFFRLNRATLLAIVVGALLLPLVHITIPVQEATLCEIASEEAVTQLEDYTAVRQTDSNTPADIPAALYIIGVALMAVYQARGLFRIRQLLRQGCLWREEEQGVTVYCHAGSEPSYNWMNSVVISEADYQHHPEVMAHELAHVRHRHSYDNLLLALCQCVQWFNPFVYALAASLKEVHEYEADRDVLRGGANARQYQLLLVGKAARQEPLPLVNGFVYRRLKQRIRMMLRQPSAPWRRSKLAVLLPMVAVLLLAVARYEILRDRQPAPAVAEEGQGREPKAQPASPAPTAHPDKPTAKREQPPVPQPTVPQEAAQEAPASPVMEPTQMAQFPGGNAALRAYLAQHLPQLEDEGRLLVRFVVNEDGSLRDISILRSGGSYEANQAALRLVADMPRWIPGHRNGQIIASPYILPIAFNN